MRMGVVVALLSLMISTMRMRMKPMTPMLTKRTTTMITMISAPVENYRHVARMVVPLEAILTRVPHPASSANTKSNANTNTKSNANTNTDATLP